MGTEADSVNLERIANSLEAIQKLTANFCSYLPHLEHLEAISDKLEPLGEVLEQFDAIKGNQAIFYTRLELLEAKLTNAMSENNQRLTDYLDDDGLKELRVWLQKICNNTELT